MNVLKFTSKNYGGDLTKSWPKHSVLFELHFISSKRRRRKRRNNCQQKKGSCKISEVEAEKPIFFRLRSLVVCSQNTIIFFNGFSTI